MAGVLAICGVLLSGIAWLTLRKARRAESTHQNDNSHCDSAGLFGSVASIDSLRVSDYASDCGIADTDASGGGCDSGGGD